MRAMLAIYQRELLILRKRFFRQLASMSVSPLLYLIAFGLGMGRDVKVGGHSYLQFLIPGLVAMNSMIQAFAIASEINIARFYWHIFEEFQAAPISNISYVTGEVLAGITRALFSAAVDSFDRGPVRCGSLLQLLFLVCGGAEQLRFRITGRRARDARKIAFRPGASHQLLHYSNGFFRRDFLSSGQNAKWVQYILHFLPLTHASKAIRAAAFGEPAGFFILSASRFAWSRSFRPCLPLGLPRSRIKSFPAIHPPYGNTDKLLLDKDLYEGAFKRSLCWPRRRLLDVLWCTPASSPSRRLVIILNATPHYPFWTSLFQKTSMPSFPKFACTSSHP